jgi:hypothetical protein
MERPTTMTKSPPYRKRWKPGWSVVWSPCQPIAHTAQTIRSRSPIPVSPLCPFRCCHHTIMDLPDMIRHPRRHREAFPTASGES